VFAGGVWHVAQSVRVGWVNTNLGPAAWHSVHCVERALWLGGALWQLAQPVAAMSWQAEHPTVTWLGMSAFPRPTTAVAVVSGVR